MHARLVLSRVLCFYTVQGMVLPTWSLGLPVSFEAVEIVPTDILQATLM